MDSAHEMIEAPLTTPSTELTPVPAGNMATAPMNESASLIANQPEPQASASETEIVPQSVPAVDGISPVSRIAPPARQLPPVVLINGEEFPVPAKRIQILKK
jgi:hypothetical protein